MKMLQCCKHGCVVYAVFFEKEMTKSKDATFPTSETGLRGLKTVLGS